jgi:hypothetical protein
MAAPLYRMLMMELERRRVALGWPMWKLDDKAGTQDGYYAKMLYPDTPTGRQARWETVQLVVDALFPEGIRQVTLEPENDALLTAPSIDKGRDTGALMVRHWRHSKHFRELGAKGGRAYAEKVSPHRRSAIARRGAQARWKRWRVEQATAKQRAPEKTSHGQDGNGRVVASSDGRPRQREKNLF